MTGDVWLSDRMTHFWAKKGVGEADVMTPSPTLKPQNKHLGSGPLGTLAYFGDANLMLDFLGERPNTLLPTPPLLEGVSSWQRSGSTSQEDPCLLCGLRLQVFSKA